MNSEYDKEVFEEEVMFDGVCVSLINDKISELSEKYNCDYMVYRSWDNETISGYNKESISERIDRMKKEAREEAAKQLKLSELDRAMHELSKLLKERDYILRKIREVQSYTELHPYRNEYLSGGR